MSVCYCKYLNTAESSSLWVSLCMHPLDGAVTIEVLYSFPVHPVHLKARLLGQIAGLHYGARSVDVWEPQNMADFVNCHLIGRYSKNCCWNELNLRWFFSSIASHAVVRLLWEGWCHCQHWDQWNARRRQSVYHPGTRREQILDQCHQTSDCNPDAFLCGI